MIAVLLLNLVILYLSISFTNELTQNDSCKHTLMLFTIIKLICGFTTGYSVLFLVQNYFVVSNNTEKTTIFVLLLAVLFLLCSLAILILLMMIESDIKNCKSTRDNSALSLPNNLWYSIVAYILTMVVFVFMSFMKSKRSSVIKTNSVYNWRNIDDNTYFLKQIAEEQYKKCGLTFEHADEPALVLKAYINKLDMEKRQKTSWFSKMVGGGAAEIPTTKYPNIVKMKAILESSVKK